MVWAVIPVWLCMSRSSKRTLLFLLVSNVIMWCNTDRYFPVFEWLSWYWQYCDYMKDVQITYIWTTVLCCQHITVYWFSAKIDLFFFRFKNISMDSCSDYFKNTPLHVSAAKAKIDVVQYLINEKKVSPFVRNRYIIAKGLLTYRRMNSWA